MQYEQFTRESWAELTRIRPISPEEYEALIAQVVDNFVEARAEILKRGDSDIAKEALSAAVTSVLGSMDKRWRVTGCLPLSVGTPQYLRRAITNKTRDAERRRRLREREELSVDLDLEPVGGTGPTGRYVRLTDDVVSSAYRRPADAFLDAIAPSVLCLVASRSLRLLETRQRRPQFKTPEATVARFFQDAELGLRAMNSDDHLVVEQFTDARKWKSELAEVLRVAPSTLSGFLKAVADRIREALYLFLVLAPPGHAVVDPRSMDDLYDVAYQNGHGLVTLTRKLLQKAGPLLERRDHDWHIDLVQYVATAREDLAATLGQRSDAQILTGLHRAEVLYATHVPHQRYSPPRFRCVIRCLEHHRPV